MEILLNYPVYNKSLEDCVNSILICINSSKKVSKHKQLSLNFSQAQTDITCRYAACINPHSYCEAQKDPDFQSALKTSDWLLPDGVGITMASRILGGSIRKRITGSDLFAALSQKMNAYSGYRVFLMGSTPKTLEKICARMAKDYPNITIAGSYSPPYKSSFTPDDIAKMVSMVNHANTDVLWVAMTAPKQEKLLYQCFNELNVPFAGAIGAVFDFYAKNIIRPNAFFQNMGLEWLPRLLQEPRRLYKRMAMSAPMFLGAVFKEYLIKKLFKHH